MEISLELDRAGIFKHFGDSILDEHTFAAYGFSLMHVKGDNQGEQLINILTEIFTLLKEGHSKKQISLSIYFEPKIYDGWCGCNGPAVCIYLGCSDDEFFKSNIDHLNRQIMKMSNYINAESYSPSENTIFLGYFSPINKTLYLEKRDQMSWCIAKEISPAVYLASKNNPKDLISTIPADVMRLIVNKKVIEAGFGAGPSCVAGKIQKYPEPVNLEEGICWIEKYCETMKAGHLLLDDLTTLWLRSYGFTRYDQVPNKKPPRSGVEVKTAD